MAVIWNQVRDVLDEVLQVAPEERSRYLDRACPEPELRQCVESLIVSYDNAGEFLEVGAFDERSNLWNDAGSAKSWIGRRIGPYRIEEEIGEGGMGTVFRAVRADDEYHKQVAIKLVKGGFGPSSALARFKSERQILANLEHPNIARLLDGGRTEEGFPYLVMELVDGVPIDEYCDAHKLSISERLELFRVVCGAVQFAHQNLVIHRDLKPANILVTAEGVPKLLDFGIAKLLSPDPLAAAPEQTLSLVRILTPDYASPEQIRGDAVTTATDVYSLGVVLYILLSGHPPYRLANSSPQRLAEVIGNIQPAKPSEMVNVTHVISAPCAGGVLTMTPEAVSSARTGKPEKLRRRLSGDLDNIALMALRKDPRRRYSSVEHFSDDIKRHLDGLPVFAREDTFAYRGTKFVRRHSVAVAASVIFLITLLGGIAATLRETGIARAQRAKAEHRFSDVRKLANSLIFEVHDSIKDLPGATPARKLIVDRALQYLDSLSREAGDPSLQRELATAYEKVGDVQGNPFNANLGDISGALVSYRKAAAIRESLLKGDPYSATLKWSLWGDYVAIGWSLEARHDFPSALENMRRALVISASLLAETQDAQALDRMAGGYWGMGNILTETGDLPSALESYRKGAALRKSAHPANLAQSALLRTHLAGDYSGIARVLASQEQLAPAIDAQQQATALLEELSMADPLNATLRSFLADSYQFLGADLNDYGDLEQALQYLRRAQKIYQGLANVDSSNVLIPYRLGYTDLGIGRVLLKKRNAAEGMQSLREALTIFRHLAKSHPDNSFNGEGLSDVYFSLGEAYQDLAADAHHSRSAQLKDWQTAINHYQESRSILSDLQSRGALDAQNAKGLPKVKQKIATCEVAIATLHSP